MGLLLDAAGDDRYDVSLGVSQGCGHDLSVGVLWDRAGEDAYLGGRTLAQGAGNDNGLGLLVDEGGVDAYRARARSQGSGNRYEPRGWGSAGVLLDLGDGGEDAGGFRVQEDFGVRLDE